MALRPFDDIKDLNGTKFLWSICVRIVDLWYIQKTPKGGHLEMILMDSKGDKIQVTLKGDMFLEWNEKLKEKSTYVMHNFSVARNDLQFKPCDHPYRMYFTKGTTLREKEVEDIPQNQYQFKSYSDILAGKFRPDILVDVIGAVDHIGIMQPNGNLKKAAFTLKDLSGQVINCTLWNLYAKQFIEYHNQNSGAGLIVIVLTHTRIKEPEGIYPVSVSNSWNGSRLLINEDIPEIQDFKNNFASIEGLATSSQTLSQLTPGSQFSEKERFLYKAQIKSISELHDFSTNEEITCVTVGTTAIHMVGKDGWFYEGCSGCSKKTCTCVNETSIPRYKLEIGVVHKKGRVKVIFWDRHCADMVGISAAALRDQMLKEGEDDPKVYPVLLDKMMARTIALKFKVQPGYKTYSLQNWSENKELIQHIEEFIQAQEGTSGVEKEIVEQSQSIQYESDIQIPQQTISGMNESVDFDSQTLSATADHDPELIGQITPAKRGSSEIGIQDMLTQDFVTSAQLSSTKITKHIKNE